MKSEYSNVHPTAHIRVLYFMFLCTPNYVYTLVYPSNKLHGKKFTARQKVKINTEAVPTNQKKQRWFRDEPRLTSGWKFCLKDSKTKNIDVGVGLGNEGLVFLLIPLHFF